MWQSNAGLVQYNETRSWTADNMLRHLSDPVHSLRDSLQTSGSLSGSVLRRCVCSTRTVIQSRSRMHVLIVVQACVAASCY